MIEFLRVDKEPEWKKFEGARLGNNIHVWRFDLETGFELAKKNIFILSSEEIRKIHRFVKIEDQKRQMISKVMRKLIIGNYLDLLPEKIEFRKNEYSKPSLQGINSLKFNISHSGDWVMFVFASKCCGIDVEGVVSGFDFEPLLTISLSQLETKAILEASYPLHEFIRLWTIKESLLKATGEGLTDIVKEINGLEGKRKLPSNFDSKNKDWTNLSYNIGDDYFWSVTFENKLNEVQFFEMD